MGGPCSPPQTRGQTLSNGSASRMRIKSPRGMHQSVHHHCCTSYMVTVDPFMYADDLCALVSSRKASGLPQGLSRGAVRKVVTAEQCSGGGWVWWLQKPLPGARGRG